MMLFKFFFEGLSGLIFALLCLAALVVIAFVYINRYEKERAKNDMLDKAERWARIADGVAEWDE